MKKKELIITVFLTCLFIVLLIIIEYDKTTITYAENYYQVYLNGDKIGLIANEEELYDLINDEQKDIKDSYNVSNVYPPNGFSIEQHKTYDEDITDVKTVYNKIKEADDFTIEGYIVKIKPVDSDKKEITLYVLNQEVFESALTNVVTAFVEKGDFDSYINSSQEEIDDVGQIIEKMYFEETITMKLSHISVHEKIYTDPIELSQYLLFGSTKAKSKYTIKEGDTIDSISSENKLNPQEFLIANPKFKNKESILAIGDKVNISLINPLLTLVEDLYVVEDSEQTFERETVYDKDKPITFEEVTQQGVTGIVRYTRKKQVINGEEGQGAEPLSVVTIREAKNEITTKGGTKPKTYRPSTITGTYVDTGGEWGWPTNRPYIITSNFEWRWGSFHNAIDISGTGFGSPIYASREGTVVSLVNTCANFGSYRNSCGNTYGNHVVIQHNNGMYTMYAHLTKDVKVSVGQQVGRGSVIGFMGSSGSSTGAHLHFGVSRGEPDIGTWLNPWSLFR